MGIQAGDLLFLSRDGDTRVVFQRLSEPRASGLRRGPIGHAAVAGKAESQATVGDDQPRRQVHEFLNDGFQTASFGAMTHQADVVGEVE